MAEIDKFKTCKDCPDRTAIPNCHDDCEGYQDRREKQRAIAQKRNQETDFDRYLAEAVERVKNYYKKKGTRKK